MKVAVYTKESLAQNAYKTALVQNLKASEGFTVTEVGLNGKKSAIDVPADCDRLLVFGGDGTMLVAAKSSSAPILGINLGNLGFLAELEAGAPIETVISALNGGVVKSRLMLNATGKAFDEDALNDVTVKSSDARPIVLNLIVDGNFVDSYHSDGVIVCTPTGSTAYSLSAGGPVLAPEVNALAVNPVCPHSLHSRPLVVSSSSVIEITLTGGKGATVIVDGDERSSMVCGDSIKIVKSNKSASFIETGDGNFYKKLLEKMNRWGVTI